MFSSGSSSLKVTQISKTDRAKFISIRTIDFETDRFDGDPRDAILKGNLCTVDVMCL